jgi:hypothetical protein
VSIFIRVKGAMKITTLLMQPYLEQLEHEFNALNMAVSCHESLDSAALCRDIETRLNDVRALQSRYAEITGEIVPSEFHDEFRRLKLDARFMRRRWLKIISNTERVKKMFERRRHVSTFAA